MAKRKKSPSVKKSKAEKEIKFDYLKTEQFRNIYIDGAFGGISPMGTTIQMAVYSERLPIPQQTTHPIAEDGKLGEEIRTKRETRDAIVRNLEANIIMDGPTALRLIKWLEEKVEQLSKAQEQRENKTEKA